jgi:general stress protein 26
MEASRNYWIASVSPGGRPHVAPVWGVWYQDAFYFSTDQHSRKGLNIASRPSVVIHLESGDEAVMIQGQAEPTKETPLLREVDGEYFKKYAYHLDAGQTYKVSPKIALAWTEKDFTGNATKWELP